MKQKGSTLLVLLIIVSLVAGVTFWIYFQRVAEQSLENRTKDILTGNEQSVMREDPRKPCDFNLDGRVDNQDISILNATFGKCLGDSTYNREADFFRDGCVDEQDKQICLSKLNQSTRVN